MDDTTPVTRTRRWRLVATFEVPDSPDPVYDVRASDALADELGDQIHLALDSIARIDGASIDIEDVGTLSDE